MDEGDADFDVPMFEPDGFKQWVAADMGLDLSNNPNAITWTKLALPCNENEYPAVGYRFDLSIGKYHACALPPVLSMDYARSVAHGFIDLIKKWYNETVEQKNMDKHSGDQEVK